MGLQPIRYGFRSVDELDTLRDRRLVVVSNRLPIVIEGSDERAAITQASGGLVTAMVPILKKKKGLWIGWPGFTECPELEVRRLVDQFGEEGGYTLHPLFLTEEEVHLYYDGFSNEIIWPLFHDLHTSCNFAPEYWKGYQAVNRKFAKELIQLHQSGDFIWIQDYHLILLARELRKAGITTKLAFFLHVPFAPLDIFSKIPWRVELLKALLEFDYLGFQTDRDRLNFIQCVDTLLKEVSVDSLEKASICHTKSREVNVDTFPISIDIKEFTDHANSNEVVEEIDHIHETLANRKIVFSVDRLDYTKGIRYRLKAIRAFLEMHPEMHEQVTFVQLVVPSRCHIPEYLDLKEQIDQMVSEINSEFTTLGWVPIHYMFQSIDRKQLVAYYRAADALLVTSLKDGMNLVAKEFIASNVTENGVLILSEFTGAACQLSENSLLINPCDTVGVANTIYRALTMPEEERKLKMHNLRESVAEEDIHHWIASVTGVESITAEK